jgi:CheY-like chemotaxis protein
MAKTIVLVEDDLDIQRVYGEKLKMEGYDVHLAIDPSHALQLVNEVKPNLILLDIMMPGKMNGFDMLEHLKNDSRFKDIPVICLTNLDTEKEQAMKVGAADYLVKADTDLATLTSKIAQFI